MRTSASVFHIDDSATSIANDNDAFVTIPREAPSLAYRYLFDRQSFYAPHRSR